MLRLNEPCRASCLGVWLGYEHESLHDLIRRGDWWELTAWSSFFRWGLWQWNRCTEVFSARRGNVLSRLEEEVSSVKWLGSSSTIWPSDHSAFVKQAGLGWLGLGQGSSSSPKLRRSFEPVRLGSLGQGLHFFPSWLVYCLVLSFLSSWTPRQMVIFYPQAITLPPQSYKLGLSLSFFHRSLTSTVWYLLSICLYELFWLVSRFSLFANFVHRDMGTNFPSALERRSGLFPEYLADLILSWFKFLLSFFLKALDLSESFVE